MDADVVIVGAGIVGLASAYKLAEAGRSEEAVGMFRSAVERDPANWSTRHNLAAALLDHRDAAAAEIEARKAVAANPDDAGSYDLLGRALAAAAVQSVSMSGFRTYELYAVRDGRTVSLASVLRPPGQRGSEVDLPLCGGAGLLAVAGGPVQRP